MGEKTDQQAVINKLESIVKDFEPLYQKFLKEWDAIIAEIDPDDFDEDRYPVISSLEEYDTTIALMGDSLDEMLKDFKK